jgi:DNA-binding NarL/FixJ family response regulator
MAVPNPKRILIVDDHPIVREGLTLLINRGEDLVVCEHARDARTALNAIRSVKVDMVIVDISLGGSDGIALTRTIKEHYPDIMILVLSMHDETLFGERALKAGADGYVMKHEPAETVMQAIRLVSKGETYLSREMSARILSRYIRGRSNKPGKEDSPMAALTDRELEIYQLIGLGRSARQIAEELHVSTKTVETHRSHMTEKLGLKSTNELLKHAFHWVQQPS